MTNVKDKPGGRPAKKRIEKQQRVVSTKLTELQYYVIRKRAGEAGLRVSEYVRQAVVSAEVIPRPNGQDADTIHEAGREITASSSWRIGQMPEVSHTGGGGDGGETQKQDCQSINSCQIVGKIKKEAGLRVA